MPRLYKMLLTILLLGVTAYTGLCLFFFFTQRSFIYFPRQRQNKSTEILKVDTPQAVIECSVHNLQSEHAILYFGGNAEDVSSSLPEYSREFSDAALYMMHYRGYGGSSGKPTEHALREDALAVYKYIRARHSKILFVGRSLGSSIAIGVAAQVNPTGLVLITPFDSIQNIAKQVMPFLPLQLLIKDPYLSFQFAPKIKCPTLVLAASSDDVVPAKNTMRLLKAFSPGITTLQIIPGTNHNSISASTLYWSRMRQFVKTVFRTP